MARFADKRFLVALGLKVQRFAVIRGIRHHDGFAHELRGVAPEFTRALNARAIMSGVIPEINDSSEIPYCIWYPEPPIPGDPAQFGEALSQHDISRCSLLCRGGIF